jgi:soluble lytic murein transglycosylase-like protein
MDQLMPAVPAVATKPVAASAGETASQREQQAVAEFIAKRYRVAEDVVTNFVSIAYRAGEKYSLDPLLILAVMAVESRYNPVAESFVGARGLMQIIPKYHPEKLDAHGGEHALLEPEVNILVGAQILREYLRRFGDTETALQVYNGALDEPTARYSNKVFAEKALLEAMRVKARSKTAQSA